MGSISLVTGGSRGIGRNIATSIADLGGDVVITYREAEQEAQAVVDEIESRGRRAAALQLDTGQIGLLPSFARTLQRTLETVWNCGSVDHIINNAGNGHMANFADTTEQQFDDLFNVHVKGVYFLTQALLPMLSDGGRIVNITSFVTRIAMPGFSAYSAAKGALEVLTRCLAKELAERRITVNVIAPGVIETDFLGGAARDDAYYNQMFADMTALGRVGLPEDVGPVVASLLCANNRWVTAQRIEVSGGQAI